MPGTRKLGRTSDSRNAMMRAMAATCTPSVRSTPTSPRKMLQRSCLMRSAPSTLTATAATPASSRSALAAATLLRWQFWSSS